MSRSGSVLIIDDERRWREDLRTLLTNDGILAETASELDVAEAKLREASFDLLLVDRKFGDDTERGLEIVKILKRRHPDQELILLTSHLDQDATLKVMMNDAHTALSKQDPDALLRHVRDVLLKRALRLGRLPKPFTNAFFTSPPLAPLRAGLAALDDPRACFFETIALSHLLIAAGAADRVTVGRVTEGTRLATQLPQIAELDAVALATLAELAPAVAKEFGLEEARASLHAPDAILVARAKPLLQLLVAGLITPAGPFSSDQDRIAALLELLKADLGFAPFVLEATTSCLLNLATQPELRPLNVVSLVALHAQKSLDRLVEIERLTAEHTARPALEDEVEAIHLLRSVQKEYTYLNEIRAFPLEHGDWLETFANHLLPLMAEARLLQRYETMLPVLVKATENCRILLQRFNEKFASFIWDDRSGYPAWVGGARPARPLMTPDIVREVVVPELDRHRTVFLIIFDGMSLLSWTRIREGYLRDRFNVTRDEPAMAIVPTATRYARSAIFAGTFPRAYLTPSSQQNPNERRLLNENLKALRAGLSVAARDFMKYHEVQDGKEDDSIKAQLKDLIASRSRLKVIIFDPHDKVTHIAPGHAEDFSELFYARSIHPVMERISLLPDTAVVVAVDHGFCEITELKTVRGIFAGTQPRASDTLYDPRAEDRQGHFGKRYIDLGTRQFNPSQGAAWLRFIPSPGLWGLPDTNGFLIAAGDSGFSLETGRTRMFAHGGVSLEEMIVPVAVLSTR